MKVLFGWDLLDNGALLSSIVMLEDVVAVADFDRIFENFITLISCFVLSSL